jgi:hypothetical protein
MVHADLNHSGVQEGSNSAWLSTCLQSSLNTLVVAFEPRTSSRIKSFGQSPLAKISTLGDRTSKRTLEYRFGSFVIKND